MSARAGSSPVQLAIFATHPIQYHLPWFRALAARPEIDLVVYYALLPDREQQGTGFGVPFTWDLPMLEGYRWEELPSASRRPSLDGFFSNRLRRVAPRLAARRPDVAIFTGWHSVALLQALWACRRVGVPCLVRGESNALRPRPAWARLVHRRLLRYYDGFLAIGVSNWEFYLLNGVPAGKIFNCPYFVDNQRFAAAAESLAGRRDQLRERWGIRPGEVCFLFAGKLIPKKRLFDLLAGIGEARRRSDSIRLLVVGEGPLMEEARRRVARESLPVSFAGFLNQTEMPEAYVAADCLVLPSDHGETWGLVVNEAMACGLPAIVSDRVGCGPDLVEEGVTGFRYACGRPGELADVIGRFANGDLAREMGQRARRRVLDDYSVERAVAGTLDAVDLVRPSPHVSSRNRLC